MPLARSNDPLVWIDCEMTGLDPDHDTILQICCIITDAQLNVLEPEGFDAVIHHSDSVLDHMSACAAEAADSLLAYIRRHVPTPRTALLAGNSVHADKAFLARGPYARVLEHLHYRLLDVSSLKEAARRWGSEELLAQVPVKREVHLARDDILESIAEMRFYREKLFAPGRE
ncbi:Oligoribonuclease [Penicillium oxalicum]|uniref:Oligoribonuclease n=1 Tax=Penicillium oxalicum TaxID=69781 RepID=UPI0020B651BE|nr:Oligoribonuclease [Penicillium oxalicum]KAI2793063.1 Oligoribonuclease [Penicillium oxalicum]